ncbi:D-beta-hydroxybutyrate dehydrogenase-like [Ptychodera flava]|uniref:D-beta-hydroxybutyrate dehydrogenase-like n=1 Tax=Ptychodera flava TaxID=63121 RepID=UPI00396A4B82
MENSDTSRYAFVTGATSGIGLAIARKLAQHGYNILYNGFGDDALIVKLQEEFEKVYKVRAHYLPGDLTKQDDIERTCQEILKINKTGVDVLVNNAGFQYVSPVQDFPVEKWNDMISVMLTAPFIFIKHLLPGMLEKGWGRIINISSVHGQVASKDKTAYVSAKHGIIGLTKTVALETAGTGVTCNALCPGWVGTELFWKQVRAKAKDQGIAEEEAKNNIVSAKQPSGETVEEDHLGEAVLFMCSQAASQMTGSCLTIDGGWLAQ